MADAIESARNPRLRRARLLLESRRARERDGLLCVEGEDLVEVALARGLVPVDVLVRAGTSLPASLAGLAGLAAPVEPALLDAIGTLGHGARVLATFRRADLPAAPAASRRALWLDGVGDPGNVGTLLRGALALGGDAVGLGPGSADPTGPKALRASMGAVFAVPAVAVDDPRAWLPDARLVALDGAGDVDLRDVPLAGPVCFLLGAERAGLSDAARAAADVVCRIPQAGPVGSLNVAMAGTVALYEAARAG